MRLTPLSSDAAAELSDALYDFSDETIVENHEKRDFVGQYPPRSFSTRMKSFLLQFPEFRQGIHPTTVPIKENLEGKTAVC